MYKHRESAFLIFDTIRELKLYLIKKNYVEIQKVIELGIAKIVTK